MGARGYMNERVKLVFLNKQVVSKYKTIPTVFFVFLRRYLPSVVKPHKMLSIVEVSKFDHRDVLPHHNDHRKY